MIGGSRRTARLRKRQPKMPVGSTWGMTLTGAMGSTSGCANIAHQFDLAMGLRLQPVAVPFLGRSGGLIFRIDSPPNNVVWIDPYATDALLAQRPDCYIFGPCGDNDNILSTDPSGSLVLGDWKTAVSRAYVGWLAYASPTGIFVVHATPPSEKTGEATYRTPAWAEQKAHVATLSRAIWVSGEYMLPNASFSGDVGGQYVHKNELAAYLGGQALKAAIDPFVEQATPDEVMDMIFGNTYPLMEGSQLDTDRGMTGTGGTLTSVTDGGGGIAASKLVQNTTGSATVSAAMVNGTGTRKRLRVTLGGGTVSSAGKIMAGDKNNFAITATPGKWARHGCRITAPAGHDNFGADHGNFGVFAAGSAAGPNGQSGAAETHPFDGIMSIPGNTLYFSDTTYSSKRNFSFRYNLSRTPTGDIDFYDFFTYLVTERNRVPAAYIGALSGADGIHSLSQFVRLRPSGTISMAAGGTIRVEPGGFMPRGLLPADYTAKRIYKGVVGDTGLGTGTLIATLGVGTWTNAFGIAAVTTADKIFVEVDVLCPLTGNTISARSSATDVVTAT